MIIEFISKWIVMILNPFEHLFKVRVREVNRHWPHMGTIVGILTMAQVNQESFRLTPVQVVVGLDSPLAAHHRGRLESKLSDCQLTIF